jgi:hypothetical protein
MKPLNVARSRLKRAEAHFALAAVQWNSFPVEDLYKISLKVDANGDGRIRVGKNKPIPEENSLLLGEALYQLRSALDACIYQGSIYASGQNPPPDENKLEFPICADANEFPRLAKRRLFALPQKVQEEIERMQPYNTPSSLPAADLVRSVNRTLGILNDLARKDRHRTLHVVGSWISDAQPKLDLPKGVRLASLTRIMGGFLTDWSDLATFKLIGFRQGMRIEANPFLTTEMALNEPPTACHENDTWGQRLNQMLTTVEFVIGDLESCF